MTGAEIISQTAQDPHLRHHQAQCLNCGATVETPYCGYCGQSGHTHRFSIRHFFTHDLVHGLFHVDRGFFHTIKALFTTPGRSIREYIQGRRASYFNYFTLLVLIVTIGHLLSGLTKVKLQDIMDTDMKKVATVLDHWASTYPKLFAMATIPLYAAFSFIWFRRARLNYSEHLVLNTFKISGEMLIAICFTVVSIFYTNLAVLKPLYSLVAFASFSYSVWFYFHFFEGVGYSRKARFIRSFAASVSLFLLSGLITFLIIGVRTGIFAPKP